VGGKALFAAGSFIGLNKFHKAVHPVDQSVSPYIDIIPDITFTAVIISKNGVEHRDKDAK
jgi:hypothetical protein